MIADNLLKIKKRISSACSKSNHDPGRVKVVAVSKGRSIAEIKEAQDAGLSDIGENKIQEALLKYSQLSEIKWNMVGHLQTNKVKEAVRIFDLIQSVDSLRLAKEIDQQAFRANKMQDILVKVNVSGEGQKFGLKPGDAIGVISEIAKLKNIKIKGLMTVAPIVGDPEEARPCFRKLKELLDKINELRVTGYGLQILSMGMTDDFEIAIEEGSNMVRLGRAIFEKVA